MIRDRLPHTMVYGTGLAFHPIPAVKIAAIPALVTAEGESAFLARGNLEYAIHAGPFTLSPSVSLDFVHEEVLYVAGLAVGMGFWRRGRVLLAATPGPSGP